VPDVTGDRTTDPPLPGTDRRSTAVQQGFERFLAMSRLLTLIPVIFLLVDAAGSFVYGADILIRTAYGDFGEPSRIGGRLGIFLIAMDTFLVGATLLIAAFGFYELFVIRTERPGHAHWLPRWLVMRDLEDLKARVTSMLILVAAITFVDVLVESHDERGILLLGAGVAAVIIGLTIFLRFGRRHGDAPAVTANQAPAAASPAAGPAASGPAASGPAAAHPAVPGHAPASGAASKVRRSVVAIGGLATVDLREPDPPGGPRSAQVPIEIRLVAVLGQVTVLVPAEMQVADSGVTFLGIRSVRGHATAPVSAAPTLVTRGASILGRVKIVRTVSSLGPDLDIA
jgi:uncharacterized membrane protein YqhA